jgi:TonB family protein
MLTSIRDSFGLSRRAFALGAILVFHALIVYVFASGLGRSFNILAPQPIQATVSIDRPAPQLPPHLPPAKFQSPTVTLVPPIVAVDPGPPSDTQLQVLPTPAAPVEPVAPKTPEAPLPVRLVGHNSLPNSQDFYPPDLIRQGIEGAANVRVCVDTKGARQGDPVLEESSGNARLDEGALRIARAGKYARAVQGDMPVPTCYRFHIGFNLK